MTLEEKKLTLDQGRALVKRLEKRASETYGPGTLSGMWSDGKIAWKIYLGKERGTFYQSSTDNISEADVLNMVRAIRDGKSVGGGGSIVQSNKPIEFKSVKDKATNWWQSKGKRTEKSEPKPEIILDEEDVARAQELGIKQKDIDAGGGTRKDEDGNSYWLNLKQLIELDELDASISDDDEFNEAFYDMRKREGIKTTRKAVRWDDDYDSYSTSKGGYMKSWWGGGGWSGGKDSFGSTGSELSRRLATALGMISTTVEVINNTGKRWKVELASEEPDPDGFTAPTSYTSYEEKRVVVSPGALLDSSLAENQQIEITTGYGLHEASHVEYSESLMKALKYPTPLMPLAVSSMLHNILEDIRIEALTGEKFPGFASFFETMNDYLWRTAVSVHPLEAWGPELNDKLNAIVRISKWPKEFEPIARADADLSTEYDWFRTWVDNYIEGGIDIRTSIQRALDHLKEDPKTNRQLREQEEAEKKLGALKEMLDQKFNEMLKQAMDELKKGGKLDGTCPSPGAPGKDPGGPKKEGEGETLLDAETGSEVDRLIREQFRLEALELPEQFRDQSGHVPKVEVTRPEGEELTKMPPDPLLNRLRHAFRFRKARPMYSNRLMKSGGLDEDEMWRVLGHDNRIFEQRVIEEDPETQVTMLIDSSGSMSGNNILKATRLARIMLECLKDMKGTRIRVRSHTTGGYGGSGGEVAMYRIWEPGDPLDRIQVAQQVPMGGNYDAYAIAWAANELVKNQRPGEDMVLFVLSDGRPNGMGLAGMNGIQEVRKIVEHYEPKGVTIIQIAIDNSVGAAYQKQMYNHYIEFKDDQTLPMQLTNMLIKLFSAND